MNLTLFFQILILVCIIGAVLLCRSCITCAKHSSESESGKSNQFNTWDGAAIINFLGAVALIGLAIGCTVHLGHRMIFNENMLEKNLREQEDAFQIRCREKIEDLNKFLKSLEERVGKLPK